MPIRVKRRSVYVYKIKHRVLSRVQFVGNFVRDKRSPIECLAVVLGLLKHDFPCLPTTPVLYLPGDGNQGGEDGERF